MELYPPSESLGVCSFSSQNNNSLIKPHSKNNTTLEVSNITKCRPGLITNDEHNSKRFLLFRHKETKQFYQLIVYFIWVLHIKFFGVHTLAFTLA